MNSSPETNSILSSPNLQYRSLEEVPARYRSIFSSYPCFNAIQSYVLDDLLQTTNSLVIAAPTGSGKTVLFELAIIELLLRQKDLDTDFKIVYVAPVKALCTERYNDWFDRFGSVGITCIEVTGDTEDFYDLRGYNIILTTPEKWDSLTRRWRDNLSLVQMVKLFLIDEVHLLNDEKRGPILETIICRMKTVANTLKSQYNQSDHCLRFLAVSATIKNVNDLAVWLGDADNPGVYFKFGNETRPVSLKKVVKGYEVQNGKSEFLFDMNLSYKLKNLLSTYSEGKPVLIFCSTRKSVQQTCQVLSQQITYNFTEDQSENIRKAVSLLRENKLKDLVKSGVAYHHAGMSFNDRQVIQQFFSSGYLPVLVATTTLAMGVNLPAHLVIIKSTQQFIGGQVIEYPESSVLQMIGRAGRPQYDDSATAVIMTKMNMVQKYENMLDCKEVLESSLHKHLAEHLNSEIVLRTITDISVAVEWVLSTFLCVRAKANPQYYGFSTSGNIEKKLFDICLSEINSLKNNTLADMNENGMDVSPTSNGRLVSYYYLSIDTFKIFLKITGEESLSDLISCISGASEFNESHLRNSERKLLNSLNKCANRECIRFPLQGKVHDKGMKINVLIQACLGCLSLPDPSLNQESVRIVKTAERVVKCLAEYLSKKNYFKSLLSASILAKCLHCRLWENSPFIARQLERIGPILGPLLASVGKTTFKSLEESNPRDLERILNRAPPFGNVLVSAVSHLPKYEVDFTVADTGKYITVDIQVSIGNLSLVLERNTAGENHKTSLIVGDSDNKLLTFHKISDQSLYTEGFTTSVNISKHNVPSSVLIHLISEEWIGIDVERVCPLLPETIEYCSTKPEQVANRRASKKVGVVGSTKTDVEKVECRKRKKKDTKEESLSSPSRERAKRVCLGELWSDFVLSRQNTNCPVGGSSSTFDMSQFSSFKNKENSPLKESITETSRSSTIQRFGDQFGLGSVWSQNYPKTTAYNPNPADIVNGADCVEEVASSKFTQVNERLNSPKNKKLKDVKVPDRCFGEVSNLASNLNHELFKEISTNDRQTNEMKSKINVTDLFTELRPLRDISEPVNKMEFEKDPVSMSNVGRLFSDLPLQRKLPNSENKTEKVFLMSRLNSERGVDSSSKMKMSNSDKVHHRLMTATLNLPMSDESNSCKTQSFGETVHRTNLVTDQNLTRFEKTEPTVPHLSRDLSPKSLLNCWLADGLRPTSSFAASEKQNSSYLSDKPKSTSNFFTDKPSFPDKSSFMSKYSTARPSSPSDYFSDKSSSISKYSTTRPSSSSDYFLDKSSSMSKYSTARPSSSSDYFSDKSSTMSKYSTAKPSSSSDYFSDKLSSMSKYSRGKPSSSSDYWSNTKNSSTDIFQTQKLISNLSTGGRISTSVLSDPKRDRLRFEEELNQEINDQSKDDNPAALKNQINDVVTGNKFGGKLNVNSKLKSLGDNELFQKYFDFSKVSLTNRAEKKPFAPPPIGSDLQMKSSLMTNSDERKSRFYSSYNNNFDRVYDMMILSRVKNSQQVKENMEREEEKVKAVPDDDDGLDELSDSSGDEDEPDIDVNYWKSRC